MEGKREIRLRVRIDDTGLPLQLRRAENQIVQTFARAGASAAAQFTKIAGAYQRSPTTTPTSLSMAMYQRHVGGASNAANLIGNTPAANVQRVNGLLRNLNTIAAGAGRSVATIPVAFGRLSLMLPNIASAVYLTRNLAGAIDSVLSPLKRVSDRFIQANEAARRFRIAVGAIGGDVQARRLERQLTTASLSSPSSVEDLRESSLLLARLPAFANRLAGKDAAGEVVRINQLIQRLATLDPAQGPIGARVAISELSEGAGGEAFQSLRRRFGITASTVARAAGASLDEVKRDPNLALAGVEKLVETLLPDSALAQSSNLFTTKIQKLRDGLDAALVRVGDAGLFDSLVGRVSSMVDSVFGFVESSQFERQARRISDAAGGVVDSFGEGLRRFAREFAGAGPGQSTLDAFGSIVTTSLERAAGLAKNAPALLQTFGAVAGTMKASFDLLIDGVIRLADTIASVASLPSNITGALKGQQSVAGEAQARRLVAMAGGNPDDIRIFQREGADNRSWIDPYAFGARAVRMATGSKPTQPYLNFSNFSTEQQGILQRVSSRELFTPEDLAAFRRTMGQLAQQIATPSAAGGDSPTKFGEIELLQRRLDRVGGPNFGALQLEQNAPFGRLSELVDAESDRLSDLVGAGVSAFRANGSVIDRINARLLDVLNEFDTALADASKRLAGSTDEVFRRELSIVIETTKRQRAETIDSFRIASQVTADGLTEAANNYVFGVANELASDGLLSDAALRLSRGQSRQVQNALGRLNELGVIAGPIGLEQLPIRQQQQFATRLSESSLDTIESRSRIGDIRPGMNAAQLSRLAAVRPDDNAIQAAQIRQIESRLLPLQSSILDQANAAFADNPDDPLAARAAAEAARQYGELAARLHDLRDELGGVVPAFREFASAARESLESNLGNAIGNLIRGTGSLRDALVGFSDDIISAFSRMAANQLLMGLIGGLGQPQASGQAGGLGGILGALFSGSSAGAGAGASVQAFARGGVLNHPTLAIAGEAGQEAFVPMRGGAIPLRVGRDGVSVSLPGGRSIPTTADVGVSMFSRGGITGLSRGVYMPDRGAFDVARAGGAGDIYVVADLPSAVKMGFRSERDTLVNMMASDISKGGRLAKAAKR